MEGKQSDMFQHLNDNDWRKGIKKTAVGNSLGLKKNKTDILLSFFFFFKKPLLLAIAGKRVINLASNFFDPILQLLDFSIHYGNILTLNLIYTFFFFWILGCTECALSQTDCAKPPLKAV